MMSSRAAPHDAVVLAGGAGALGAAVLEQVLGRGGYARVGVLVTQPLKATMRRLVPIDWPDATALREFGAHTALIVFDRERGTHGRELGMYLPAPDELASLAAALHRAGVEHLLVVLPHDTVGLPAALRSGLASLDEQSVAALGFEHLVIMRPAEVARAPREHALLRRVARWMLQQLRLMVAQAQQPVRTVKVAQFAAELAKRLPHSPAGTRVVPPELVWLASQNVDQGDYACRWLAGEPLPVITPVVRRM